MELKKIEKLKIVKEFGTHNHADRVYLLEGGIVKKHYPDTTRNKKFFDKEIEMMNHLKKCKFVANLINYDRDTLTIYMSYCGTTPRRTKNNLDKIYRAAEKLHRKWGVVRHDEQGKVVYNIYLPNTGLLNNRIYFFDLAGDKWSIEPWALESGAVPRSSKDKK